MLAFASMDNLYWPALGDHQRNAMNTAIRTAIVLLLAIPASIAMAQGEPDSLDGCVTLGNGYQIIRNSGSQSFLVQDGEANYKVAMQGSCGSLSITPELKISTEGQEGRLCAAGTQVKTKLDTCKVGRVSLVSDEDIERARRRSR